MNLYSIPPLLTFICFISLAILTVARWRNSTVNLLFLLICILGAGLYADILFIFNASSFKSALRVTRVDQFFSLFLIPLYVHFFHAYLGIRNRKWLVAAFYAVPGVLVWFGMTPLLIESMHHYPFGYFGKAGKLYPLITIPAMCATVYGAWILGRAIYKASDRSRKRRLKYLFIGFVSIAVLTGMNFIPLYGHPLYPPGNFCFIPLLVFAVGLFRHDLLNMGLLVKKGLVYSVLTAALTGIYAIIVVAANRLFSAVGFSESVLLHAMLFIVIAFIFGPLNTYVRKTVDRIFNKKQYNYRKIIRKNSRMIASVLQLDGVARQLVETVRHSMGVGHCLIFIRTGEHGRALSRKCRLPAAPDRYPDRLRPGNPLLEYFGRNNNSAYRKKSESMADRGSDNFLLNENLERYDAVLAVPMIFKGTLNGLMITGEKDCGAPFSSEDTDLLETLASHGALAVENARTYQAIESLNRNLESRVVERTRRLKVAVEEKERTLEQLVRSESLAAIGQLVAGVAHELNNPLASVKSLLQSFLEDLEPGAANKDIDAELLDDLRFADRELDRAAGIVSSLLGLSRQTQTYREPVDVNSVLNDALRVLQNKCKHFELSIEKKFAQKLPLIMGNFSNLGQVAINIIGNAIDALPGQKGIVGLVTAYSPETDEIIFECIDTGPGIPDSIRREIFKPFFTTKPVGRGTGLGLYICHEIVSRHGGVITVESAPGSGARVIVRLPVDSNQAKDAASIDIGKARH
jgi:two-component system NtrC family sensor kinase